MSPAICGSLSIEPRIQEEHQGALIAAVSSVVGSVLTFIIGIRSVRRSVSTSNGEPLGRVLEARLDRLERRLDGLDSAVGEVREWLAFREGRERPPFWMPHGTE